MTTWLTTMGLSLSMALCPTSPKDGGPGRACAEQSFAVLAQLEQTYQRRRTPAALLALAEGYDRASLDADALDAYRRYLGKAPRSPQAALVQLRIAALEKALQERSAAREQARRARLPRGFDVSVGLLVHGRQFSFAEDEQGQRCYRRADRQGSASQPSGGSVPYDPVIPCPRFPASVTLGLRLDATGYPLGRLRHRALRQLGLGATLDLPFWANTRIDSEARSTRELQLSAGLRWTFQPSSRRDRAAVLASLQYHLHSFSIEEGLRESGLPALRYQALELEAGARLPFLMNDAIYVGMDLRLRYRAVLAVGALAELCRDDACQAGGYGPAHGHGVGVQMTALEILPYRGVSVRLQGYYDCYLLGFAQADFKPPVARDPAAAPRFLAAGATEHSFGGALLIGYQR